ncbi:MAG: alpha-D-ribose 1-methylphosphonate 5-triphosphate diphosphatase [Rhodoplanes sp.]
MSGQPTRDAALRIENGRVLAGDRFDDATVEVTADGLIGRAGSGYSPRRLDAEGLLVLPGIVDIHGDAFERQMMPRAGVYFPIETALLESDRQAVANGITTVFHGVTWSWEPGLRGPDNARAILTAIEGLQSKFAADTRFHLRHEIYNLDAEGDITSWLSAGRIDALAFNDHMPLVNGAVKRSRSLERMIERSELSREEFIRVAERVRRRADEVSLSIVRLAAAASAHGVPLISHDDASPDQRRWFRSLGCRVAEFPMTIETVEEASAAGDYVVLGAPNVVRGGSHVGWIGAADMIARGLCSVLTSDYYYPALMLAPFRLAALQVLPLEQAWMLVSDRPAQAVGLYDRGLIAVGRRADLVLVDATSDEWPRVVATVVAGRIVQFNEVDRLFAGRKRKAVHTAWNLLK